MRFYINNRGTFGVSFSSGRRKKGGVISALLGWAIFFFFIYLISR